MFLIYNFKERLFSKLQKIFFERFEYKQINIPDQIRANSNTEIPNIVYQTWLSKKLPWRLAEQIKIFRNLNKDFSFLIFSDEERDNYMHNNWRDHGIYKIYCNSIFQPSKADIWRYCILYERGGFYFDIKSGCNLPLKKLKKSDGAIISFEPFINTCLPHLECINKVENSLNNVENWGFGFRKNHQLLKMTIDNICKYSNHIRNKVFENPKSAILAFTGPGMLTKTYREYIIKYKIIKPNGINFFGEGLYEMDGGKYRFKYKPSYGTISNSKILL